LQEVQKDCSVLDVALLHALQEQLNAAVRELPRTALTRRDLCVPTIPNKAHAIIGMRRAGRTCFLRQLQNACRAKVPAERAIFIGFDDDRLAGMDAVQLDELLEEYYRRYPHFRRRERVWWYLDEIQLVPGWDRFVRRVMDTEQIDFVVSGSSARLLSREIHSSLRGRAVATVVSPFSFREFLRHRGEEPESSARRFVAAERSAAEKRLREFLVVGGFPEAQGLDDATRIALLQGYVDTVLFRDVVERYGVTQVAALRWITRHALRSPCGSFSANRLYHDLRSQGHAIGKASVHDLLGHLIDAFLLAAVPVATESERRRNTNPRKLYPVDPGLIQAFDSSGRGNTGHALELVVFNELQRQGADVAYVKTKEDLEVDFLARFPGGREELIQVCADPADPATLGRELAALDAAGKEHPRASRRLIVMNASAAGRIRHPHAEPVAAHEWLLSGAP
jgi:predicted AAA+ superfamily ATPase